MGLDRLIPNRHQRLEIGEIRALCPIANPLVETQLSEDGSVLITASLEDQGKGVMAVLARWMKMPATKKFELEPIGGFVWSLCDGKHTVGAISKKLQERYKMNRLESEAALTSFLRMLGQRRLVTLVSRSKRK